MSEQKSKISILDIIIESDKHHIPLNITCMAGRKNLSNKITQTINRPGLALNQFFNNFGEERIQIFGRGEVNFLYELEKQNKLKEVLENFFSHDIPCCIVSHIPENTPPDMFIQICKEKNCPLLFSSLSTSEMSIRLYRIINRCFAPSKIYHGVFVDIRDLGVLITGDSGVGKSESALGILARGNSRLIADDTVLLERTDETTIVGRSPDISRYKHHLEIRGLGFVNLSQIFGINVMLKSKKLNMVIQLREWDREIENKMDRLEHTQSIEIFGIDIPLVTIPVKAGRDIPLIIETAVIKRRLQLMGYHGKEDPFLW